MPAHAFLRQLLSENALHFEHAELHLVQITREQDAAAVQQADMVADVLELAQVVRGDDRRQAAALHILANRLLTVCRTTGSRPSKVSSQNR